MRVILLAVVLSAGSAFACSCGLRATLFPSDQSTNVPTNVVLQGFAEEGAVSLARRDDHSNVPLNIERVGALVSFRPTQVLERDTVYDVAISGSVIQSFTTGAGEDLDAPTGTSLTKSTYTYVPAEFTCRDQRG